MTYTFDFATSGRIIFGSGKVKEIPDISSNFGKHALLVTGKNYYRYETIQKALEIKGLGITQYSICNEPKIQDIERGIQIAKEVGCDLVLSLGGGSVIDSGKAIAAMLGNQGVLLDYLEVVGRGNALQKPSFPHIVMPTTAGTGAEVTRNAVLESTEHKVKASMRSPFMLPDVALIDPELTLDLPKTVTASTGLDALTQLLEAFVSPFANPITDGFCRQGLLFVGRSLRRAYDHGHDLKAREEMAMASCFSGIALANAKLGAVHGLAGPLGGRYSAPHGMLCARLAPLVMRENLYALTLEQPNSPALERYEEASRLLTGNQQASVEDGLKFLQELSSDFGVPDLSILGIKKEHVSEMALQSQKSSSMKGNPILLKKEILEKILIEAL